MNDGFALIIDVTWHVRLLDKASPSPSPPPPPPPSLSPITHNPPGSINVPN